MKDKRISDFVRRLMDFYESHSRHELPWRQPAPDGSFDPYKIWLSEVMLQQTQVQRVIEKYHLFLSHYPAVHDLAAAGFEEVLRDWNGLGYNRRAKYLHQSAQRIVAEYSGTLPETIAELDTLPGIGYDTAAAIYVYAYNKPAVFIETNVRSVFIFEFFADRVDVHDSELKPLIEQAMSGLEPRLFYWALMDYGSYLKRLDRTLTNRSKHYVKQPSFKGSQRELRGRIIRLLLERGSSSLDDILMSLEDERAIEAIDVLVREGVLSRQDSLVKIAE